MTTTVRLPAPVHQGLKRYASARGISLNDALIEASQTLLSRDGGTPGRRARIAQTFRTLRAWKADPAWTRPRFSRAVR